MKLAESEIKELQAKYSYLTNYDAEEPDALIDPQTYVDSNGDALLHIAAQQGELRTVEVLLKGGADPNLAGDMGNTALHYARTEEMARLLVAHGASTQTLNEFGKAPTFKG